MFSPIIIIIIIEHICWNIKILSNYKNHTLGERLCLAVWSASMNLKRRYLGPIRVAAPQKKPTNKQTFTKYDI
jgi:hypothetical protein